MELSEGGREMLKLLIELLLDLGELLRVKTLEIDWNARLATLISHV